MDSTLHDRRPVRRVQRHPAAQYDPAAWPYRLGPVSQLLTDGLDLPAGVTFLVGENGSGKSTLVEAIAAAAGLNPEGGSRNTRPVTRVSESPLHEALQLVRSPGAARWSYFLRAETMHGLYGYLEDLVPEDPSLHELSHGESFLEVLGQSFDRPGFYVLDEPEAALSFTGCLGLVALMAELANLGSQLLCATHSPLLTALPGAAVLQLTDSGFTRTTWPELELVAHWRRYLEDPTALPPTPALRQHSPRNQGEPGSAETSAVAPTLSAAAARTPSTAPSRGVSVYSSGPRRSIDARCLSRRRSTVVSRTIIPAGRGGPPDWRATRQPRGRCRARPGAPRPQPLCGGRRWSPDPPYGVVLTTLEQARRLLKEQRDGVDLVAELLAERRQAAALE